MPVTALTGHKLCPIHEPAPRALYKAYFSFNAEKAPGLTSAVEPALAGCLSVGK